MSEPRTRSTPRNRTFLTSPVVVLVVAGLLIGAAVVRMTQSPTPCPTSFNAAPAATTKADTPDSFASSAQESIAKREYEATETDRGLQAPNRAHNLRTYFKPWGIRVEDRTADDQQELLRMRTIAVGRSGQMRPLGAGQVSPTGARVENRRRNGVTEWYVNGESGLEHGYVLNREPSGTGELWIEVEFEGANVTVQDGRAKISAEGGRKLEYGKLTVKDATGGEIASRMEAMDGRRVRLAIEDAGAVYPLVVDPLLTSTADSVLQSDQAGAQMGIGVAGAGDVNGDGYADVIVGAHGYDAGQTDEGAAFVFHGGPSGIASGSPGAASATLQSDQASAAFGETVACAGDVNGDGYSDVIIGAALYDAGQTSEGAAFVFHGGPSGIASGNPGTAHTTLVSDQEGAEIGKDVACAGDVNGDGYADVIVGAISYSAGQFHEGAAFVYHGGPAGIASGNPGTANATLESDQGSAEMGVSVAGAGDVNGDGYADIIVGANEFDAGETGEGAAFVYYGGPSGVASGNPGTADATLQSNHVGAGFGQSAECAGDVNGDGYADVIVGAYLYDAVQENEGAAFVFHGGPTGISSGNPATADATIESNQASAFLGFRVAGAGDVNGDGFADVIVGAYFYAAGQPAEGAAFVFHGGPIGITSGNPMTANATLQSDQDSARLGQSVAGAGDVNGDGYADVIVGAVNFDAGQSDEGAAFVYTGGAEGVRSGSPATANATLQSDQVDAFLGLSVAGAGDVNGDGYADVIVGAEDYDLGQLNEGAAFVFHGGSSGIPTANPSMADATLESDQESAKFAVAVAGAGDVNGDGYADVIVGAREYDAGQSNEGAAFVFHGGPAGIMSGNPSTANATLESDQGLARFGTSVAGAGDVNGDGYADVIVGAIYYASGQMDEGAAFVFHGGPTGVSSRNSLIANATLQSDQADAEMGWSVAGAGDVNGDGYADVIIGAPLFDSGQQDEGAAFVFQGGETGITSGNPATAVATLQSDQVAAFLGQSVASAGDVNGDGFADVIVGAYNFTSGQAGEGAAFVFHGSTFGVANGTPSTANTTLQSNQDSASLGLCVSGAGDVNGDQYADVIVGAYFYDGGQALEGAAFVFHGGSTGISSGNPGTANTTLQANQDGARYGRSVACAGDVNGDGYADVIVGADRYDSGQADEGAVFVHHGNGDGFGRAVRSRQLRGGGDTTSVEPWGSSIDTDDFQVRMTATHPLGRGKVKLEIQATPDGENWGGPNSVTVSSTSWTDVIAISAGVTLTETVTGLAPSTLYRWRARVLYAPFTFVNSPISPSHGPWRRLRGQAVEADVRTARCTVTCPANITASATNGTCSAAVSFAPTSSGDCEPVSCNPASGSVFVVGTTTVTCSEPGGPQCSFTVTVNDTQAPVVTCPAPITVGNTTGQCSAVVNFVASASDNCPGATTACVPASGSTFPIGVTMVTCTATDASANTGNCTFTVTVNDTQAPALSCPPNLQTTALTAAGRVVSYTVPTATDNCGATVTCLPPSGSTFAIGTTTVTCTATDAANNSTNCQFTVEVAPLGTDTAGIYVPGTGSWFLRNANSPGAADLVFGYGPANLGWVALRGDWDGNGTDTAGLYDPANGNFFLKNTNAAGGADFVYGFGPAGFGWQPLVGDWNGDGVDTIGLYDPSSGFFFLRNTHAPGAADLVYGFGPAGTGWTPMPGDWDGNGTDTVGLYDPATGNFFLRNAHAPGGADLVYGFGPAGLGWKPLAGDWNGDGADTIGLYSPANGFFFLRNFHAPGAADVVFGYGPANSTPIPGDWNGQ